VRCGKGAVACMGELMLHMQFGMQLPWELVMERCAEETLPAGLVSCDSDAWGR